MKNYVKPELNVVELSVKENMAALPVGIETAPESISVTTNVDGDVPLTVYNLTTLNTSQVNG
ncbi:MAG: hypothetical protein IJB70_02635 [Clostridia bacterium]|nr:hypothetical protein [Clostridia bacterium]